MTGAWRSHAKSLSLAAAIVLAAVLLVYSVRGIDWHEASRIVAGASPGLLAVSGLLSTVALFLRAIRWRLLLSAAGPVDASTAFWATAAGYLGNSLLPARAGELVRTVMISSRAGLDGAFVLTTALAERVADAVALAAISAIVLLTTPARPGWLAESARPFALIAVLGGLAIAVLPMLGSTGRAIIARAPMPHALRPKLAAAMEQVLRGLRVFHDPARVAGFFALTAAIWCLDAIGAVTGAAALGLHLPIAGAFLLIAGLSAGSALPSTPGYVGIYQFVAVTVLQPFGFSRTDAIAFILVAQALMYVVIGFWGAIGLMRYRRSRRSA